MLLVVDINFHTVLKATIGPRVTINNIIDKLLWWRSIVVKTAGSAGVLSLSCARLRAGRVTTLWVKRPLSVSQLGRLSLPGVGK